MERMEFKSKIIGLGFYNTYTSFGSVDNERTMVFRPKIGNSLDVVIECSVYGMNLFKDGEVYLELINNEEDSMYDTVYNEVLLMVRSERIKKILTNDDDDEYSRTL